MGKTDIDISNSHAVCICVYVVEGRGRFTGETVQEQWNMMELDMSLEDSGKGRLPKKLKPSLREEAEVCQEVGESQGQGKEGRFRRGADVPRASGESTETA